MPDINLVFALVGGLLLVLGLLSGSIKAHTPLSEPLIALLAGVALGPQVLGLIDLGTEPHSMEILEQVSRMTVALAVVAAALRLPAGYVGAHKRDILIVLGVIMPLMWLVSSGLALLVIGAPFSLALLLGAVITPTDPVVSATIVSGTLAERAIPARLRHIISAESAANDGLAYPLVLLPILFMKHAPSQALTEWLLNVILWQIVAATFIGLAIGFLAAKALLLVRARLTTERASLVTVALALTFAVLGLVKLLGGDGILAAFTAGLMFRKHILSELNTEEEVIQESMERFFTLPVFVLLGVLLPWREWAVMGATGVWFVVAVLALRRLPLMLALGKTVHALKGPLRMRLFAGWFGPIGVAALFYATFVLRVEGAEAVWRYGSLVVAGSVLAHGLSATPLTHLYSKGESEQD